jgi:ATP-binding cassette subfamily F protein 3
LLISLDREFLDEVCTHTLHLHEQRAKLYTGDYTSFERQRAEQLRQQQIAHEKEQIERAHLQKFIDRFKAKASKAKQAQSRMKRLQKLAGTEAVRAERALHIDFAEPAKLPNSLIRLSDAVAGYRVTQGEAHDENEAIAPHAATGEIAVLHDVGFGLEAGDRIGLLGPNGAGKSTLVKSLVGELPLLRGERNAHPDLRIGYFAQHTVESLHPGQSAIQHLRDIAPSVATQEFRDFLGRWNFPGDRAFESVDGFSGGERARLALALIAWRKPNVLLLDEPTNHLDLDMREALAEALSDFAGAIVLVSHDRHLIGLVCDQYWRVADAQVAEFDGDLDAYASWLRSRAGDTRGSDAAKPAAPKAVTPRENPQARQQRKRLTQVEARMALLQDEIAATDARLADPTLYAGDPDQVARLSREQAARRDEHATLEAEWLRLYETVDG